MSRLLINEPPLQVLPSLAVKVGLNEAIILQQLHYWSERSKVEINGATWVYNTVQQWREQFPFWSDDTISRALKSLREKGVVIAERLSKDPFNKTLYYRIDYRSLHASDADEVQSSIAAKQPHSIAASCGDRDTQIAVISITETTVTETTAERASRKRAAPASRLTAQDLKTEGVDESYAEAWLAIRREKRLPLTVKAWELTAQDGASVGLTAEQTVTACVRRGWAAFRADWWLRDQNQSRGQESFRERDARLAAERVREMTGGLGHDRAALGDPLPFERGYVPPQDVIEGEGHVRRIR